MKKILPSKRKTKTVAVIVAHPDDETLWAGGLILSHPTWQWHIACLCRSNDTDRAPRFRSALEILRSQGSIGDLDDGPRQISLNEKDVEDAIQRLLPPRHFDLIVTHNPTGEYTKHLRHMEISKATIELFSAGRISAGELWTFAYEDWNGHYYPRADRSAHLYQTLTKQVWNSKYGIITKTYGFGKDSWEANATPRAEAFWKFTNPQKALQWLKRGGLPE
jgi:LmbE family N-acetylglucosaminyl deacetylase